MQFARSTLRMRTKTLRMRTNTALRSPVDRSIDVQLSWLARSLTRQVHTMESSSLSTGLDPSSSASSSIDTTIGSRGAGRRGSRERATDEPSSSTATAAASKDDSLTGEDVRVKREAPVGLWSEEEEDPYVRKPGFAY